MENHRSDFEPAMVLGLVAIRGTAQAPEGGGVRRGGEDGEAGNLVVFHQLHVSLRVRVGHLNHH